MRTFGPFNALVGWEWRCRDCASVTNTMLTGEKNPKSPSKYTGPPVVVTRDAKGKATAEQTCPTCSQGVMAQLKLSKFVVPSGAGVAAPKAPAAPAAMAPAAG